jgi:GNAT superfamily N-acetyltransferase
VLFGRVDYLPGLIGVATWRGPHATSEAPEQLAQAGFDDLLDGVPLKSFGAVFDVVTAAVRRVAPEPHWHLRLLAVDPDHQGGGLGAALLQCGAQIAATSSKPVVP